MERDRLLVRERERDRDRDHDHGASKKHKLGVVSGVYVPVCLSILSILMFLRFGLILGQVGLLGMLGLLGLSYLVDFITTLSLSAVASNGEVKGGGTYYLISRSLGPEFGGSIGLLFYLSQVLNTALNVVGLIDCIYLSFGPSLPHGYWVGYLSQTAVLVGCTLLCFAGSGLFAKASNGLLAILTLATLSIPISALFHVPFADPVRGIEFTGLRLATLRSNLLPHAGDGHSFAGLTTFREFFGILFPATSGIFAGASMSGDLRNPSKSIPVGTLWAMLSTFVVYLLVILSLAASTTHDSLLFQPNIIQETSIWAPLIVAGECAVTFFSALMGLIAASKLMQALGRDKLLPGLAVFSWGTKKTDEPLLALMVTYAIAQFALFADLNQIATFISMGYMVTFFVMNLACFLLKIGSAPNFRPAFKFFSWQTAFFGSLTSAGAMFFIDATYATSAVILLVVLFLLIHYLSPPKRWGDVSQNLIYHQVRKYLLRLRPEHIKFWRPQIILLINNPRRQTRLIQFCNSMKKGSLYILGHAIVTDDFDTGVYEAKLQHAMWNEYISEYSRIKAFVQLTMSPSITWGVRNLILSSGLGGMRPNIAVLGFYNLDELRATQPFVPMPWLPIPSFGAATATPSPDPESRPAAGNVGVPRRRRRGDTTSRILEGILPTDVIKTEGMMKVTEYATILEDLALRHRINVAVAKGFHTLETPRPDSSKTKKYIDLWPIQMSAELEADGKSVLTTNFDTYTLILQLGYILHSVPAWKQVYNIRVMVFVEYESEVDEERGRLEALLEKLRISAEVHVFWLASGDLTTYETIIHGRSSDPSAERLVDAVLKDDPWWDDMRRTRGKASSSSPSAADGTPSCRDKVTPRIRRPSMVHIEELQKHSTVSTLARLGLSMGYRTQNLGSKISARSEYGDVIEDNSSTMDMDPGNDSSTDQSDLDPDFNDSESAASEGDLDATDGTGAARRKSHWDTILRRSTLRGKKMDDKRKSPMSNSSSADQTPPSVTPPGRNYGTMSTTSLSSADAADLWARRTLSSSMRFSSSLVPETRTANPGETGRTIMFAETAGPGRMEDATLSRTNSRQSRGGLTNKSGATAAGPSVTFVEPQRDQKNAQAPFRPHLLRHSSTPIVQLNSGDGAGDDTQNSAADGPSSGDVRIGIAGLLADYKTRQRVDGGEGGSGENGNGTESRDNDGDSISGSTGSSYATQSLSLSFNDLPRRAQHLILNELMRQQSTGAGGNAGVLFTTLPIPDEGTCRSETASLQYLADVELLCQGLPPVLMILSNNMTVTPGYVSESHISAVFQRLSFPMKNPLNRHSETANNPSAEKDSRESARENSSRGFRNFAQRLRSPTSPKPTATVFQRVHHPDRPPVPVLSTDIPTEDECRVLLKQTARSPGFKTIIKQEPEAEAAEGAASRKRGGWSTKQEDVSRGIKSNSTNISIGTEIDTAADDEE
ncbi:k-cl co-transporter [Grosmannia clavigera kw1407]|uniref:K-cl co-transporter n=1 Tax=Grosmannia clavigera (strain kw1407 / UAMH 11150) TaxID=655863 RepID=F0XEM3_GROCL|nr:k-cl co-transporter [Grosmannia clavigera kw1407]EFX04077.1 k-cl co-transporter [Grosmannia clavigera kw1407]